MKVKFCNGKLDGWYENKTIYIHCKLRGVEKSLVFMHELVHYVIDLLHGNNFIDEVYDLLFVLFDVNDFNKVWTFVWYLKYYAAQEGAPAYKRTSDSPDNHVKHQKESSVSVAELIKTKIPIS